MYNELSNQARTRCVARLRVINSERVDTEIVSIHTVIPELSQGRIRALKPTSKGIRST
jgi:hypothetical protein